MAVSKMELINITGPIDRFDEVTRAVVAQGSFQPENIKDVLIGFKYMYPFTSDNPYRNILKSLTAFLDRADIPIKAISEVLPDRIETISDYIKRCTESLDKQDSEIERIKNDISNMEQIIDQIQFLENTDLDLNDIYHFQFIKFRFGCLSRKAYENLNYLEQEGALFVFIPTRAEGKTVWGMYFAAKSDIEYVDSMFASVGFERIYLNKKLSGTSMDIKEQIHQQVQKEKQLLANEYAERNRILAESAEYMQKAYATVCLYSAAADLKKTSGHTASKFYMSGWVEKKNAKAFCIKIEEIAGVNCTEELPSFTKAQAPTKLKNSALFKPFEMFVNMYGTPRYGEFDPTALVAITYSVFFGIMFGDLGQGLVIALIGIILGLFLKKDFGKILISCGLCSAAFGTIYDSVFGYEGVLHRIFHGALFEYAPASPGNMMRTLLLALGFGAVTIGIVMLLKIINGLRQKDYENALFGNNGVAGLVFYAALIYLLSGVVMNMLLGTSIDTLSAATPIFILGLIVLPLLLMFFKKPLADLITGKKDWFPRPFGSFVLESVFEMIEVLLSYVTNTISFVRVGAFALSHSGMMYVVFLLAGTSATAAFGSGSLPVVAIGNLAVMGLEGLIVGIQVLRLEFYEMFGRFYAGDGTAFNPVRAQN